MNLRLACALLGVACVAAISCVALAEEPDDAGDTSDKGDTDGTWLANPEPSAADSGERAARAPRAHGPGASAATSEALSEERLRELLRRREHEPAVSALVRAALAAHAEAPDRFDSMLHRARLRGLVPSLELGARRGQGVDLRSAADSSVDGVRLTTADDLTLMASLRFELGRLLFAGEEMSIARERRADRARRAELARVVVELYFRRKRLVLERDLRGRSDIDHEVRIAEAEALLDAFTNGAFQRMMARSTAWTTDASTDATKPR